MRILIVTGIYPPDIGGPATYTKLMEENLQKEGIAVRVLPFSVVRQFPKIIRHIVFLVKIILKSGKIDLIYAQDPISVGFPALCASKILRKKFLIRIAGDYAWEQARQRFGVKDTIDIFQCKKYDFRTEIIRKLQKYVASRADMIIVPSAYFKKLVGAWTPKIKKIVAVYNGINIHDVPRSTGQFEKRTIISAGRLVPWKGYEMIIESLDKLVGWRLFIAGDGPDKKRLEDFARHLGLEKRVIFLGSLSRRQLMEMISKCEIFALNTHFESFSYQIVEAMLSGTPVIAAGVGSIPEIIEHTKSGLLIEPDHRDDFIKSVRIISSDQKLRKIIVESAMERAKYFSIDTTVKETAITIKRVINGS